jgi:hypothetical protein
MLTKSLAARRGVWFEQRAEEEHQGKEGAETLCQAMAVETLRRRLRASG